MRSIHLLARAVLPALLLLAASACGPARRLPAGEQVAITFRNESTTQVDVFAVTSSGQFRLGTVGPNRSEDLRLSETVLAAGGGGINFVARLFPSRTTVESGLVTLSRGERLLVRLPSTLNFLVVTPTG